MIETGHIPRSNRNGIVDNLFGLIMLISGVNVVNHYTNFWQNYNLPTFEHPVIDYFNNYYFLFYGVVIGLYGTFWTISKTSDISASRAQSKKVASKSKKNK